MDSELLTIVILSRDRPEFLEKCLRSIFEKQTVTPNVIVSDNSTQDHAAIKKLRSAYPITYVRQAGHLTMTEHHNACLELPSTPWLWLVHDDDELYPDAVSKVSAFVAGCRDADLVIGGVEYIDEEGKPTARWMCNAKGTVRGEDVLLTLGLDFGAFSSGTVFRVATARKNGGFADIKGVCADYAFSVRLGYSYGLAFIPEWIGRYRIGHPQSTDFSTPRKSEAYLDFVVGEALFIRTVGCSPKAAEQLIDYATWETFLRVAPHWLDSRLFFVLRLARKCLRISPRPGEWQNRVRGQYPYLFWPAQWISWPLYRGARNAVPAPVRRWIRTQLSPTESA